MDGPGATDGGDGRAPPERQPGPTERDRREQSLRRPRSKAGRDRPELRGRPVSTPLPPPERPMASVYDAAYAGVPNWDVGRPQRAFVRLAEAGLVRGPVLDVGCGTGELSLYLARRGHDVLGVDLSPLAIRQAREKARWRRIDARFLVWDALDLPRLGAAGLAFRTVVDSAMFHVLGDARSDDRAVYGITPHELRRRFGEAGGWEVVFAYETGFERRWSTTPAYFVGVRRL